MTSPKISPRVAFYGLGFVGQQLAGFALDKGWPVVAAYNRAGDKVGRDLGELIGRGPIGVVVEDCELADFSSLQADITFVAVSDRLDVNFPAYERLISAGSNILCHGSESAIPYRINPDLAEKIHQLAVANGVTFTGGGIWDMTRIWAGILSVGPNTHIDSMTHTSITDIARQGVHLLKFCGGGLTVEEYEAQGAAEQEGLKGLLTIPALCVMQALELDVTGIKESLEPVVWDHDHQSRWLDRLLPAGTVVGTRIRVAMETQQGIAVRCEFEYRDFDAEEKEYTSWKVEGKPSMEVRVIREGSSMASASSLFNRAPDVLAAGPGVVELWNYGPLRTSMLV